MLQCYVNWSLWVRTKSIVSFFAFEPAGYYHNKSVRKLNAFHSSKHRL